MLNRDREDDVHQRDSPRIHISWRHPGNKKGSGEAPLVLNGLAALVIS